MNTIISLGYIKCSCASPLEPWQNNLSNPEAYSEPYQTSKTVCSVKKKKLLIFFVEHSILDV